MLKRLALTALFLPIGIARGDAPKVDWARGLVTVEVVGIADRHAPNPAVARGTSRRGAEEMAKKAIAKELGALPLAAGGKVSDRAKDADVKKRIARAVDAAISLAADPETDGAWRVTMAVPSEAVRLAIAGPRPVPAGGDKGVPVVVVESTAKPAIGWKVGAWSAPTLWVSEAPAWAKDPPRVSAKGAKAGVIEVDGIDATDATLFVIIGKP